MITENSILYLFHKYYRDEVVNRYVYVHEQLNDVVVKMIYHNMYIYVVYLDYDFLNDI